MVDRLTERINTLENDMHIGRLSSIKRSVVAVSAALALGWTAAAQAHCDTLDGPVVSAARTALDTGNPNLVLVWVQKSDEAEIRAAFEKTRAVRKAGGEAKALADQYFFETLVRVHRAGEGAPYTGLKPAGKPEPAVAAADRAVETGKLEPLAKLVSERMHVGLDRQFRDVMARKTYNPNDVASGRAYVHSYVEYVHYAERLYDAAQTLAPAGPQAKPAAHAH
jgi:hypothetical protein